MAVVGRAYVTIRAITDQVGRDIERAIVPAAEKAGEKAGKVLGDKIKDGVDKASKKIAADPPTVTPDVDESKIKRGIDRVKEKLADLGKKKVEPKVDLDTLRLQQKIKEVSAEIDKLAAKEPTIDIDVDITAALAKLALLREEMARTRRDGEKPSKSGGGIPNPGVMIAAIVALGPGLVQVATGYIGQILAVAASIGPAIAAGVVVGLSSMVALLSTIKLVGLAFKAPTRAAMSFKESMHNVATAVGQTVGRDLFPLLNKSLDNLSNTILPGLNRELKIVGRSFGTVVLGLSNLAASPAFGPILQSVVEQNAHLFRKMGTAFTNVIEIVVSLIYYARPLTQAFGDWLVATTKAGAGAVTLAGQTGALRAWFLKAGDTAKILGDILVNTFVGLDGFFSALQPQGDSLLVTFDKVTKKFATLKDSARGQNSIAKFFTDLKPLTDGFNRLIGQIGAALGDIVRSNGSNFVAFMDALGTTIRDLVKLWIPVSQVTLPIITALVQVLGALAGAIAPLITGLGPLATAIVGMVLAFKGVTAAIALVNSLKLAILGLTATNPVILAIAAAIGIAVAAWSVFHASSQQAAQDAAALKADEDAVAATLDAQTGAITRNTVAWAAKHLQDSGALTSARDLGIAVDTATQASLGNAGALKTVNAVIDENLHGFTSLADIVSSDLNPAQQKAAIEALGLKNALVETGTAARGAGDKTRELYRATQGAKQAAGIATPSVHQLARNQVELGEKSQGAAEAIRHQIDAIRDLNNLTLGRLNSNIAYQQQIDDTRKVEEKGIKTLDTSTQVGRDHKKGLIDLITTAGAVTGSSKHQAAVLKEARDQVVAYAIATGMSAPKARLLADSMIKGTQASEANKKSNERLAEHLEKVLKPSLHDLTAEYGGVPGKVDTVAEFKKTQAAEDAANLATFIKKRVPGVSETVAQFKADQAKIDARNLRNYINGKDGLGGVNDKVVNVSFKVSTAQLSKVDTQLGPVHATGGWVHGPGTTTSDSIVARLSNKEFVVNAASAQRNAALLEAINANRLPGYVTGGSTGSRTAPALGAASVTSNYVVYARDFNDLQRQAQRLARHSAVGGVSMVGRH